MSHRADVSLRFLLLAIFLSLCVQKLCFVTSDGISITLGKPDVGNCNESFVRHFM